MRSTSRQPFNVYVVPSGSEIVLAKATPVGSGEQTPAPGVAPLQAALSALALEATTERASSAKTIPSALRGPAGAVPEQELELRKRVIGATVCTLVFSRTSAPVEPVPS